jgi:hypothetical protein
MRNVPGISKGSAGKLFRIAHAFSARARSIGLPTLDISAAVI